MSMHTFHRHRAARVAWLTGIAVLALVPCAGAQAQLSRPAVRAEPARVAVAIDGALDEHAWRSVSPASAFVQQEPHEGEPATQRTEVRFLYDDEALYIGGRMYDTEGASGVGSRVFRRDGDFECDLLQIVFDTFHDHLGRTTFIVNPAGVRGDQLGLGGADPDDSWDPVWDVATAIDSLGWTAEIRIPFSQLRFSRGTDQTWGLQVLRVTRRLNEVSMWSFVPSTETGGPAFFGHLEGLAIDATPARGEILPYVVGRDARLGTADATSPFYNANDLDARVGADFMYLLTSNLTLTGTVNPDFGQVEVDPAVVNLTAFETFYPEKRPFFIEGGGYFQFGGLRCFFCDGSGLGLFYSRRIGRAPQAGDLARAAGDHTLVPENATILGAAKVTGRTSSGWSVGLLNAVTGRERARVAAPGGERFDIEVEPLTNYFVGRVAKDGLGGDLQVRAMATSVARDLGDPALASRLVRHAEAGGLDAEWWFGERRYRWAVTVAASQATGDSSAILRLQRSSARYFQRPDREAGGNGLFTDAWDPSLTAMRGWGAESRLSREAGNWLWELNAGARSPGFETNDLAYLQRVDYAWMSANLIRRRTTPASIFRNWHVLVGAQQQYNFDGDRVGRVLRASGAARFLNYWSVQTFFSLIPATLDDQITRGGPVVRYPERGGLNFQLSTDSRKRLSANLGLYRGWNAEGAVDHRVNAAITLRPTPSLSLQLGPVFDTWESRSQYVTAVEDPTATAFYGTRYVFSDLTRRMVGMDFRLGAAFSPTATLDLYVQPLIASADYSRFKEYVAPREMAKQVYGSDVGTIGRDGGRYVVDPDGAGAAQPFTFFDPDFNFRSLRGNAVFRWEFRPGSTLFLVWTHGRSDTEPVGTLNLRHDLDALGSARSDNVLLAKLSYWLGF